MELYSSPKSFRNLKSNIQSYNDEPGFLDGAVKSTDIVELTDKVESTDRVYNPNNKRYKHDYLYSRNIHNGSNQVMSHEYFLKHESDTSLNKNTLDEELDYYSLSSFTKKEHTNDSIYTESILNTHNQELGNKIENEKLPSEIPKQKPKDKLANEFLNNNLELDNYNYLKSFNTQRVNSYIDQCYVY